MLHETTDILSFVQAFDTDEKCRSFLEEIRWPDGPVCPHCGVTKAWKTKTSSHRPGVYVCGNCDKQFTVTVGTIFEGTHLPLPKWFLAIYLISYSKKGISTNQLSKMIKTTYKTAWHLTHRIRHCMERGGIAGFLAGEVEVDETYVGGKPRKGTGKHKRGRGTDKAPVMVLVERNGKAISKPVERVNAKTLTDVIYDTVSWDSTIMTDEFRAYRGLDNVYPGHKVVNHSKGVYSLNGATTNTAESYFSLLKRGVYGTFHHVSKRHLHRYCNEFSFRWNCRKESPDYTIAQILKRMEGRRLYYRTPKGDRLVDGGTKAC